MPERSVKVGIANCFGVALALLAPLACGGKALVDSDAGGECLPGTYAECACPDSVTGVQVCRTDKTYAACTCRTVQRAEPSGGRRDAGGFAGAGISMGGRNAHAGGSTSTAGSSGAAPSDGVGGSGAAAGSGGSINTAGTGGFAGSPAANPLLVNCTKVCADGHGLMCKLMSTCVDACVATRDLTEYSTDYQAMIACWAKHLDAAAQYACFDPGDALITWPVPATICEAPTCKWTCEDATWGNVGVFERCGCQ